jgi:hypothetical protein
MSKTWFMSHFNASKTSTSILERPTAPPVHEDRPSDVATQRVLSSAGSSLSHSSQGSHGRSFFFLVSFLDETSKVFEVEKKAKGVVLLDDVSVCQTFKLPKASY